MDLQMNHQTYLVMGASRGLGRAVAETLASEGARVYATSRDAKRAGAVADEYGGIGLALDTSQPVSIEQFLQQWGERRLDGIFVNTGGPQPGGFRDVSADDWNLAYHESLLGPAMLVRGLEPFINDGGAILFNTSISVRRPIESLILSNVFRPAVAGLAKSLALEFAHRSIRVNAIAPGRIDTDRIQQLDQKEAERTHASLASIQQAHRETIPLGRSGDPEEFGRLAAFFLSPQSSYVTGEVLVISGGV